MDTTGTFSVCKELSKHKILTCLHKFYTLEDYKTFLNLEGNEIKEYMVVSTGISDADFLKLSNIMKNIDGLKWICIDVANGYMQKMIPFFVKSKREFSRCDYYCWKCCTSGNDSRIYY